MLAVDPSAGGRGIGRALAEACIARARAEGRIGDGDLHADRSMTARAPACTSRSGSDARPRVATGSTSPVDGCGRTRSGSSLRRDEDRRRLDLRTSAAPVARSTPCRGDGRAPSAGTDGLEVLLTHRPATMAFAADVHVFPGGRVDAADARSVACGAVRASAPMRPRRARRRPRPTVGARRPSRGDPRAVRGGRASCSPTRPAPRRARRARPGSALARAARRRFAEIAEALDLRLRTDLLVPLSRWVTPADLPRRFDARFFAAALPDGIEPSFEGDEVAAHAWLRPADALEAMADGRLAMWLPTSTTLQQLEHVDVDRGDRASGWRPGALGDVEVEAVSPGGDPHRHAGRRRRRGPAGLRLPRRAPQVRARSTRATRPARRSIGRSRSPRRAAAPSRPSRYPRRPGPCGRRRGGRLATRDPGPRRTGSRPAAAVHRPRARRRRGRSLRRCRSSGGPHARSATRPLAFIVGDGASVVAGDLDGVRGARTLRPSRTRVGRRRLERLAGIVPRAAVAARPSSGGRGRSPPVSAISPRRRSVGSAADEIAQEVEALVDLLGRCVRSRHQDARPAGERDAGEPSPRLLERPAGRDRRRRACR